MARFSVKHSSWFDTHEYNISAISEAVKSAGGTNVRKKHSHGMRNQPHVVTFNAKSPQQLKEIDFAIQKAVGTIWIIIDPED